MSKTQSHYHFDGLGLAMALVPHLDELTSGEKLLLVYIGGACGRGYRPFEFFQSHATVAEALGITDRTVRTGLAKLEEVGLLERIGTWRKGVIVYRVRLPEVCRERGVSHWGSGQPESDFPDPVTPETPAPTPEVLTPTPVESSDNQMQYQMQIQEPPPSPVEAPDHGAAGDGFDEMWEAYPRKTGKGQARKAYRSAVARISKGFPDREPQEVLMEVLQRFKATEWRDRAQQHIPYPATWLNSEPECSIFVAATTGPWVHSGVEAWDGAYAPPRPWWEDM